MFKYIGGILKNKHCHLYRINGVDDHLHIVTLLHPSVELATLIKDIKPASSDYIKNDGIFQKISGWQYGYGAFTYSIKEKERLIEYVKNQEKYHKIKTFSEEYIELLNEHEIEFDERYLLKKHSTTSRLCACVAFLSTAFYAVLFTFNPFGILSANIKNLLIYQSSNNTNKPFLMAPIAAKSGYKANYEAYSSCSKK